MDTPSDTSERLRALERILAPRTVADTRDRHADPVALHASTLPTDRLRQLTLVLQRQPAGTLDPVATLTLRLLLNEYTSAVGHLRAVAQAAAHVVDTTSPTVEQAVRFLEQESRRRAARD